jgi:hypothetical protein
LIDSAAMSRANRTEREVVRRLALLPVFVAVCYLFDWWQLRAATVTVLLKLSSILNLPMRRSGSDLIDLGGMKMQFGIACTMIDVFFGAIPLLWRRTVATHWNLARLMAFFGGVFALNIFRLELGFVAIHQGMPWWLAHECVAGVAYFCVFLFIMRESAWNQSGTRRSFPAVEVAASKAFA